MPSMWHWHNQVGKPPTSRHRGGNRTYPPLEKAWCSAGSASAATKPTGIDGSPAWTPSRTANSTKGRRTGWSAACATKEQNTRATRDTASPTRRCRPYPVPIRSSVSLSQLAMQSLRRQNCPSLGCSELRVVLELAWVDLCWRLGAVCGAEGAGSAGIGRPFGRFSSLGAPCGLGR